MNGDEEERRRSRRGKGGGRGGLGGWEEGEEEEKKVEEEEVEEEEVEEKHKHLKLFSSKVNIRAEAGRGRFVKTETDHHLIISSLRLSLQISGSWRGHQARGAHR